MTDELEAFILLRILLFGFGKLADTILWVCCGWLASVGKDVHLHLSIIVLASLVVLAALFVPEKMHEVAIIGTSSSSLFYQMSSLIATSAVCHHISHSGASCGAHA